MHSKVTGAISAGRGKKAFLRKLMDYLLDTNACVAILRDKPPAVRSQSEKARKTGASLAISSIVLHELWYGVYKSTRIDEGLWQLRMFLAGGIRVLEFDDEDARISGKIRAELAKSGGLIREYDTLIGGQCLRYGLTLVTNNSSEFARIRGLKCVDWTK
jgi:tRNA(fMet)-specific endonuclease VapC